MSGSWRPSAAQKLLLEAILADRPRAIETWRIWREGNRLEALEPASQLLVPMLHARLSAWELRHPLEDRYNAVGRYWLLRNVRFRRHVAKVIDELASAGVARVIVKGADALIGELYASLAVRPVISAALYIRSDERSKAQSALDAIEGRGAAGMMRGRARRAKAVLEGGRLHLTQTRERIDVIWDRGVDRDHWDRAWRRSKPAAGRAGTRHLSLEDQLLDSCVTAVHSGRDRSLFWLVDGLAIVRRGDLDWPQLAREASLMGCSYELHAVLSYLGTDWQADVPAPFLSEIASMSPRAFAPRALGPRLSRVGRRVSHALTPERHGVSAPANKAGTRRSMR